MGDTIGGPATASPWDLVGGGGKGGGKTEYAKTFMFGSSLTTEADVKKYEEAGWFGAS